jgi:hypothetical protein
VLYAEVIKEHLNGSFALVAKVNIHISGLFDGQILEKAIVSTQTIITRRSVFLHATFIRSAFPASSPTLLPREGVPREKASDTSKVSDACKNNLNRVVSFLNTLTPHIQPLQGWVVTYPLPWVAPTAMHIQVLQTCLRAAAELLLLSLIKVCVVMPLTR